MQQPITTVREITTETGFGASYDAIIMPFNYGADDITVEFTINSETYIWKVTAESTLYQAIAKLVSLDTIFRIE